VFWTAFPRAFAAVMISLALPLWLAVLGIVLRGAGFAFRKEVRGIRLQRAYGAVFAFSSLLTPFFMGAVIGAIAAGRVPADARHASLSAWTGPMSLLTGFLFVAACGFLAAVYLTGEAASRGELRLRRYFRNRALAAAVVTGALSLGGLAELHTANPVIFDHLTGRALPLVIISGLSGVAVAAVLAARASSRQRGIRVLAALSVVAVIWGWGVAQYPALLPGTGITLTSAGAPRSTLVAIGWLFVAAVVLVGPAFALLFVLHGRQILGAGDGGTMLGVGPGTSSGIGPGAGSAGRRREPRRQPGPASRTVAVALVAAGVLGRALARRRRRG
jgi:cytochrome d ubiquinol oxidase subunit II